MPYKINVDVVTEYNYDIVISTEEIQYGLLIEPNVSGTEGLNGMEFKDSIFTMIPLGTCKEA